jgi:hypothetical protein
MESARIKTVAVPDHNARFRGAPHRPNNSKQRTLDVLQNADIFTRYGQPDDYLQQLWPVAPLREAEILNALVLVKPDQTAPAVQPVRLDADQLAKANAKEETLGAGPT